MWIAQGMISDEKIDQGRDETLMDIAELYLSELASRCMVEVEVEGADPGRKYGTCKLHDLVQEMCLSMGKEEEFGLRILSYQGGNFSKLLQEALKGARYLSIHFEREHHRERDALTVTGNGKHLRSLEIQNSVEMQELPPKSIFDFKNFKLLKALVIVRFSFEGRKLPRGITDLVHLRCFRLQACELDELPSSISNLVYLDSLNLSKSKNVRVPNDLKKILQLKCLILPDYDAKTIGNYNQLRLDEGLEDLEILEGFNSSMHEVNSITRLTNLRRLSAKIYDNGSLSAIIAVIDENWTKLQFCSVEIRQGCRLTSEDRSTKLKDVLARQNLHHLSIYVQLGKQLEECRVDTISSSNLVSLFLHGCEINDDPMGILGELPSLTKLSLKCKSFVGEKMTCPAKKFPRLNLLTLERLPQLSEWTVEKGAMPRLSHIRIVCCTLLKELPSGLDSISTLKELVIMGVPELGKRALAKKDGGGGQDFDKVRHVPSIIITWCPH